MKVYGEKSKLIFWIKTFQKPQYFEVSQKVANTLIVVILTPQKIHY